MKISETIAKIDPLPGAKEFLDELRSFTQAIILSDTFEQFAAPLMKKLGLPTIFCNTLEVSPSGEITGYKILSFVVPTEDTNFQGWISFPHHRKNQGRLSAIPGIHRILRTS